MRRKHSIQTWKLAKKNWRSGDTDVRIFKICIDISDNLLFFSQVVPADSNVIICYCLLGLWTITLFQIIYLRGGVTQHYIKTMHDILADTYFIHAHKYM